MKYLSTIIKLQVIVTLVCYVTFGQVQTEEYSSDENTVLLLHLNETSGNIAYDESQYQNHGTINGNQPSEGMFFGGKTYPNNNTDLGITLPYTSSLNIVGGEPITMEAWIKTDIYFQGGTRIIGLDEYQLFLGSFGSKGHLQFFRRDGNDWNICQANNLIPLNEWVHLKGVYDGTNTRLYINGIEQEYTVFIGPYNQVDIIRIASFKGSIVQVNANVLIDEVRISNVARDKQLVAFYPFNGNANDESGNGNDGVVYGASLTTDRFNNQGSAYYFDGSDDEIILGSEAFNFVNHSYSISVWARWDKESNLGTHIFDKQGYPVNGGGGYRLYTGATGEIIFAISTEIVGSGFVEYNTHIIPNLNTWYHIVINTDVTGSTTVYINGEAKVTDLSEPLIGNAFELKLARRIDFNGSRFKGTIDDVRIYNTTLTEAEILELYGGFNDGLVAYYPFNGNANDEGGNSHHGSIIGNPAFIQDRYGTPNSALSFDGIDDWIEVNSSSLFPSDAITICYWINRDGNDITSLQNYISKELSFQSYNQDYSGGENSFASGYWLGSPGVWTGYYTNYEVGMLNEWVFYAFTYDNNTQTAKSYVNGVLDNTVVETDPNYYLRTSNQKMFIGRNGSANVYHIQGFLDDIRIYDRALTDEEVLDLYDYIIPVELIRFIATLGQDKVILDWQTATETNNSGFEVQRKSENTNWEKISFVDGHGTTTERQNYQFTDDITDVLATSLSYRLKQIDYDGSFEYSDVVEVTNLSPTDFILHQNYPNPFNPETTIKYGIPTKTNVQLQIYNAIGEMIKVLLDEEKTAGKYEISFDASNLPSGIYFYRIQAGDFVKTKKMVLLK